MNVREMHEHLVQHKKRYGRALVAVTISDNNQRINLICKDIWVEHRVVHKWKGGT